MISSLSTNRDEAKFDESSQFNLTRNPNRHLGFSYGAHVGLGRHLALLEINIFFEELSPRLKTFELAGELRRTTANQVCGTQNHFRAVLGRVSRSLS
jgi:cytochrome P450